MQLDCMVEEKSPPPRFFFLGRTTPQKTNPGDSGKIRGKAMHIPNCNFIYLKRMRKVQCQVSQKLLCSPIAISSGGGINSYPGSCVYAG